MPQNEPFLQLPTDQVQSFLYFQLHIALRSLQLYIEDHKYHPAAHNEDHLPYSHDEMRSE